MSFAAAIVIPVYNHGAAIGATVEALRRHKLPIYVVDDGSDAATQEALAQLPRHNPELHLIRLEVNQGKGVAVARGLREALAAGFTHGLQIDADGQHDPGAVPRFIARARAFPRSVIAGVPQFDGTVPRGRLYGRYLTHFWVWIETLSFAIGDSMCGCRVYPLAETVALFDRRPPCARMDFDTDTVVRLVWRGLEVVNEPLAVTYPAGGISHFDVWRDNLRISWMHTRLVFGMLVRLPRLLARKLRPRAPSSGHWSRLAERGAGWGLSSVYWCYRLLGRNAAVVMLLPVVGYFFLTGAAARRASLDYLRRCYRHFGPSPDLPREPGWREAFRHFLHFATAALDKVVAWRGDGLPQRVELADLAPIDALVRSTRGALVVGAHMGNLEMCRALAVHAGHRTINAVVHTAHAAKFARLIARSNPHSGFKLIEVDDFGADTAVILREKIDAGEWLVIVGDRTPVAENGRVVSASFLGSMALFPQGPFILAHLLQCPVYLIACLREPGAAIYRVRLERFADALVLPRQGRIEVLGQWVQRYAAWLESLCRRAPLEWFNFFDFWAHPDAELRPRPGAAPSTQVLPHA